MFIDYPEEELPVVTILIPHYKTLKLTKLCLRSLKKFTDLSKVEVVVIDNYSGDDSSAYLKSLSWIKLLSRSKIEGESPSAAHARALDMALEFVKTKYVLSIHTDTIVISNEWLDFLLSRIGVEPDTAGVGSWKLEFKPPMKRFMKDIERFWQKNIWFPLVGKGVGRLEGLGENHYYLRSHCALYKTNLVQKYTDGFEDGGETAGKVLHRKLVDNGCRMEMIPSDDLSPYMRHLNHATMILNPEIAGKKTGSRKEYNRIKRELNSLEYEKILDDDDLDNSSPPGTRISEGKL